MSSVLVMIAEFIGSLRLGKIEKQKSELLKTQNEMLEQSLRSYEADRAELELLREKVAALESDDLFEFRGRLYFKKGEQLPRCPNCKIFVSNHGSEHECPKCKWFYKAPPLAALGGGSRPTIPR